MSKVRVHEQLTKELYHIAWYSSFVIDKYNHSIVRINSLEKISRYDMMVFIGNC